MPLSSPAGSCSSIMRRRSSKHTQAEEVLKLFDSCWSGPEGLGFNWGFGLELFDSLLSIGRKVLELCYDEPRGSSTAELMAYKMNESKIIGAKNLRIRSLSDRCLGVNMSTYCGEGAGLSSEIIIRPKLQKILSGIQVVGFSREENAAKSSVVGLSGEENAAKSSVVGLSGEGNGAKSSVLGFSRGVSGGKIREKLSIVGFPREASGENGEKLGIKKQSKMTRKRRQGSLDLGFVFNEEDKNPGLISIIPDTNDEEEESCRKQGWSGKRNFVVDWKIPNLQNEMRMKDHLRVWAHTVASNVR